MIAFAIERLIPQFLLNDPNGLAVAKAIETALILANEIIQDGLDTLQNPKTMPEWRLDEMAWELGCLYDYTGTLEQKRRWITESTPLFSAYGTIRAIYNYLQGVFEEIDVEEFWEYGGDPFHFRVTVGGEWTAEKETWVNKAIANTKNVRSILDSVAVGSQCAITASGAGALLARIPYPLCGTSASAEDKL